VPWKPRYTREEAVEAVAASSTWSDALRCLGIRANGKNFGTLRKWAERWEVDTRHLPAYEPRRSVPRFTEAELHEAIAASKSWAEALRRLGRCTTGNNWLTIKKYAATWGIDTTHFDPYAASRAALARRGEPMPLSEILVEGSTYRRGKVKRRLYHAGLKQPVCEICGQDEFWHGKRMSLILDHINGVRDDHRIENLRIVCPNCAATLDTHCGRNLPFTRPCDRCGESFAPKHRAQRYCSRRCGFRGRSGGRNKGRGVPRPERRKVERPPYDQLLREIEATSYLAVGRKYGVSDNAVRKWVRWYERQAEREKAEAEVLDEAA
jgi:transposase-like protein